MLGQDKLIPPLAPEAAGIITGSEQILKDYASASSLNARDIKRLIEDVLHNPDFNADDVDTDMLERLVNSIDSGNLEIINMHQEGDGAQKLELFKRSLQRRFCENSYPTSSWLDVSTLPSRSTWILMETDCFQVIPMDLYLFNQLSFLRICEENFSCVLVMYIDTRYVYMCIV